MIHKEIYLEKVHDLRSVAHAHRDDIVGTCQLSITNMADDAADCIEALLYRYLNLENTMDKALKEFEFRLRGDQ